MAAERKIYQRKENGAIEYRSVREGLDEINHAMMDGRKAVRVMSQKSRTDWSIWYMDGRQVTLTLMDSPEAAVAEFLDDEEMRNTK